MSLVSKLASAVYNDVVSGLLGYHHNPSISMELLEDDIVDERLLILKEYSLRGTLPLKDLMVSINCIDIDCKDLDRCRCRESFCADPVAHFEIPQIFSDYGGRAIEYIGSTDRMIPFRFVTSPILNIYSKYRKRGKNKPYVYIDMTPNENGMYDCFIFGAPMIKLVSVVAVFKDLRQLENYSCCSDLDDENLSFINNEIKRRLTEKKLRYYRLLAMPPKPNDQQYSA